MDDFAGALDALRDRSFLQTRKYAEQQQRALYQGAHPKILQFTRAFIARMEKEGIPCFAHCVIRTPEEQDEMFRKGVSMLKGMNGAHPNGCAVDIIHSTKAWNLTKKQWDLWGHIGEEVAKSCSARLEWGGTWTTMYDPAHWQIANWQSEKALFPWLTQ